MRPQLSQKQWQSGGAVPLRKAEGARRGWPRPSALRTSRRVRETTCLLPRPAPFWTGGGGEVGLWVYLGAGARRMRMAGQVRGALTSWHSPLPLLAVTLYIRVTCPPRSELELPPLPLPLLPASSRLRHRGRCGGAPGAAAAFPHSGAGAPPSAAEEPPSPLVEGGGAGLRAWRLPGGE